MVPRFLTASQAQLLHRRFVLPATATSRLLTQPTLLHSAIASPAQHHHYSEAANEKEKEMKPDLFQLAAILAYKVAKNHAFQDGNKRASLLAADMFLRLNGWSLRDVTVVKHTSATFPEYGLREWHVGIASGEVSWEELAAYYRETAKRISCNAETRMVDR